MYVPVYGLRDDVSWLVADDTPFTRYTEADLGIFSMFGRTGAPQKGKKGPPQEDRQIFAT